MKKKGGGRLEAGVKLLADKAYRDTQAEITRLENQLDAGNYRSNADRVSMVNEIRRLRTFRDADKGLRIKGKKK